MRNVIVLIGLFVGFVSVASGQTQAQVGGSKVRGVETAVGNATSPIATNLAAPLDWTTEIAFIDIFKTARSWLPQCDEWADPGCPSGSGWDTGESHLLNLDADGWVRSLPAPEDAPMYTAVGTVLYQHGPNPHYPAGQYIVLYDGEGTIQYGNDAQKNVALSTPGRDVVDVTQGGGGIYIRITSTDPNGTGNYIRNIRVIVPGYEPVADSQRFYPPFLDTIANYRAIRFMNWMDTNDEFGNPNNQVAWSDRPQVDDYNYRADGVPVEVMVELVNVVDADPWFTLPHQASDDYVTHFATLVRDTLDPTLKVYVEYSNEVWNGIFGQGTWIEAQGQAEWPGSSADSFTKRLNWFGKRTAEICDIWKTVWGDRSERVVCVMGAQAANSWTASQALACPLWSEAPCADHGIDAVAIAPYFGGYLGSPGWESTVTAWTQEADGGLNSLFAELENTAVPQTATWISDSKMVADQFGVELIAYEGGQHLVGYQGVENNTAVTNLFIAANRDPRMGTVYTQYLDIWRQHGGHLFAHFINADGPSKWGSWGALEYTLQGSSPKYDALMAFIADNPCWWLGCTAVTLDNSLYLPLVTRR